MVPSSGHPGYFEATLALATANARSNICDLPFCLRLSHTQHGYCSGRGTGWIKGRVNSPELTTDDTGWRAKADRIRRYECLGDMIGERKQPQTFEIYLPPLVFNKSQRQGRLMAFIAEAKSRAEAWEKRNDNDPRGASTTKTVSRRQWALLVVGVGQSYARRVYLEGMATKMTRR